jgi:hypothetical protein
MLDLESDEYNCVDTYILHFGLHARDSPIKFLNLNFRLQ